MPLVAEQMDLVAAGGLRIVERDVGFGEQFGGPPAMRAADESSPYLQGPGLACQRTLYFRAPPVRAADVYAIVARMRLISAKASFFSDGVISEAWIPLRTMVTISSR